MPLIKVTKADIAKIQNVPPEWYGAKIVRVLAPKSAKDGQSVNYPVVFRLEHESGKEIEHNFNSKLIGMINPLHKAVFGTDVPEDFDMDTLMGKELDVKIKQTTQNGVMYDNIDAYLPKGQGKLQQTLF